ncbi:MAG: ergothioneine biosynthesis protein EgtB [Gemmatimonadetes bacterium]|nr:ergothioneine biosynthesis protein EgtB [Gemmatimonadota bacterium]
MNPKTASPTQITPFPSSDRIAELAAGYRAVREATEALCAPLSPEDATAQSMPDASPAKWHLAHTTWFFETLVLEQAIEGYRHFNDDFRVLFNSYYNTIGRQHYRPERGLITRPGLEEIKNFRAHVDGQMHALLGAGGELSEDLCSVIEVGLHHEQQHQELLLTDVKHLLSRNPLRPAYHGRVPAGEPTAAPVEWVAFEEGVRWIGHEGSRFAYDNEGPRHRQFLEAYELASRPVTNGEFLEFMTDGGYETATLWLSDGWATVRAQGWRTPLYWEEQNGEWFAFTLAGLQPIRQEDPVTHVSFYEADAYARWAGARLPTEAEWETAAAELDAHGNFVESGLLHPTAPWQAPQAMAQLFGDVWEWTQSPYTQYAGYRPPPGPLGEYNSKFMSSQMVLRGGSCATPQSHIRATYRNFFPPAARWQFSGLRVARDVQ